MRHDLWLWKEQLHVSDELSASPGYSNEGYRMWWSVIKPSVAHRLTVTVQLCSLSRADQHQNHVDPLVLQSSTWVNVFAFYQLVCVFPMIIAMCYYTHYTVVLFYYWPSDWAMRISWSEFNMITKLHRLYVCNELLSNEVRDDYDSVRKETRDESRLSAGFMRVEVEVEGRRDTKRLERQKRHEEITTQRCGGGGGVMGSQAES